MFRITMLPAADGDCFLVETSGLGGHHRLLIDGGRLDTARSYLRPLIATLPPVGSNVIDLVVLTHIDADHIEGLLDLFGAEDTPHIGEVWFNDYRHLKIAAGDSPRQARFGRKAAVLGVGQAIDLAKAVGALGCTWNAAFQNGPVMVEAEGDLPRRRLASGAVLRLLGPSRAKLAAFVNEWEAEVRKLKKKLPVLVRRPIPVPSVENLTELATQRDEPDDKKPNGPASRSFSSTRTAGCCSALTPIPMTSRGH